MVFTYSAEANFSCGFCCRLGSTPELTGAVAVPCYMGAPVIIIERLFSGQECISALEAAAAITFKRNQVKERDTGDGIREAESIQDLIKAQVLVFSNLS